MSSQELRWMANEIRRGQIFDLAQKQWETAVVQCTQQHSAKLSAALLAFQPKSLNAERECREGWANLLSEVVEIAQSTLVDSQRRLEKTLALLEKDFSDAFSKARSAVARRGWQFPCSKGALDPD